ncbi:transcriptional regulator [Halolactibacillus miurensis]|uniref:Transcriptional regulator n=1 Tax=Halolactibacillus miurensis TaxID=306541 RepID=A0A1I6V4P0_9BACI|nr:MULTISPECIES: metalloregulator ArsR/SmtB family transcription factor [Halolactibacillus]GEM05919.1 transcriptional regulator [Halolactibacillus miurensis]SFT08633.1 ArsR family transcriptional regulator [Halolactibacillus miurensis]
MNELESIKIFKAFSDPTRLRVGLLLLQKKLCVCQLQEILNTPQSKLSKHLSKMRDLNLVIGIPDGKFTKYEIVEDKFLIAILNTVKDYSSHEELFLTDLSKIDKFDYLIEGDQ